MEKTMSTGIYRIINTINGQYYIGSATNLRGRWRWHLSSLNNNKHHNLYLQRSFNLYGKENFVFDILEFCEKENLIVREQFWIDSYKSSGEVLYNICLIAGNTLGTKRSQETKTKISEAKKNISDETHGRLSVAMMGNHNSLGQKYSDEVKKKMGAPKLGKKRSIEVREKISRAKLGTTYKKRPV
jgi:group I intron endonuclease